MSRHHWRLAIIALIVVVVGTLVVLSLTGHPILWQPPAEGPRTPGLPKTPGTMQPRSPGLTLAGQVQAAEAHELKAPVAGVVMALTAPEGQPVVEGQLVLQMDVPSLRQRLSKARQELQHLKALEEKSRDPELREELTEAENRVQGMTTKLKQMEDELAQFQVQYPTAGTVLDTYRAAQSEGASAALELRRAVEAMNAAQKAASEGKPPANLNALAAALQKAQTRNAEAQARFDAAREAKSRLREEISRLKILRDRVTSGRNMLKTAQGELAKLRQNPAAAMIAQGRQKLQQSADAVAALEKQVAALAVKAPASGLLRTISVRPGQQVTAGQVLASLDEAGGSRLVCPATKQQAQQLAVGMRAQVTPARGRAFEATVSQIAIENERARIYLLPVKPGQPLPSGTVLQARL